MANKYLAREDAPFGSDLWKALDEAMVEAAKGQLVGRRILDLEGPYGLGMKSVPLKDEMTESGLIAGSTLPLILIQEGFDWAARDLAKFEMQGKARGSPDLQRERGGGRRRSDDRRRCRECGAL